MSAKPSPVLTWALVAFAAAVFVPLFITKGVGAFDFFWWMSANAALMITLSAVLDESWRREFKADLGKGLPFKVGMGLLSAGVLYGVFFVGNILARKILPGAGEGIENVYLFKEGADVWRVGILIGVLIGPAEELFWRGFLQRRLSAAHGPVAGVLLSTFVYSAIHLGSGNLMLVLAAAVCGLFWGILYQRFKSMALNVVSHVAWDLAVFLVVPFQPF